MDNNNPLYYTPTLVTDHPNIVPNIIEVDSLGIGISDYTLQNLNLSPTQNLIVAEQSFYNLNSPNNSNYTYGLQVDKTGVGVNTSLNARSSNYDYSLYVDGNMLITGTLYASNINAYNYSNIPSVLFYTGSNSTISCNLPSSVCNISYINEIINNNGCIHTSNYIVKSDNLYYYPEDGYLVIPDNYYQNIITQSYGTSNIYNSTYYGLSNDLIYNTSISNYSNISSNLNVQNYNSSSNYLFSNVYLINVDFNPNQTSPGYCNIYNYSLTSNFNWDNSYINYIENSTTLNLTSLDTSNYNYSNLSFINVTNNAYSNITEIYYSKNYYQTTNQTIDYGIVYQRTYQTQNVIDGDTNNYTISIIDKQTVSNVYIYSSCNNSNYYYYDTYVYNIGSNFIYSNTVLTNVTHSNQYAIQYIDLDGIFNGTNYYLTDQSSNYTYCNQHFNYVSSEGYYWNSNQNNGIYYAGNMTVGNLISSQNNGYAINVVKSANRNANNLQLSLQNTQSAGMRMGMIGTSNLTPAIFNTPPGTRFEMHIGRDSNYFNKLYTSSNYDPITGNLILTPDEIPHYEYYPASCNYGPNFQIDQYGNVAIHSCNIVNQSLNYNIRVISNDVFLLSNVSIPMSLEVDGPLFAQDIVMYDRGSGNTKHLDELYYRLDSTPQIFAHDIIAGQFANGLYTFTDLQVNNTFTANNINVLGSTNFINDINGQSDLIVRNVKFTGNLQTSLDGITWANIGFDIASNQYSNINFYGYGITTHGQFGTGIDAIANTIFPDDNDMDAQLVVRKTSSNNWDLKIIDVSVTGVSAYRRAAYIGHAPSNLISDGFALDGSLIFVTPLQNQSIYTGLNDIINQNFYFFPGTNIQPGGTPILTTNSPPTLNISANPINALNSQNYTPGRVGVNTYVPGYELDVAGSIKFSSKLYTTYQGVDTLLGLWYDTNNGNGIYNLYSNIAIKTTPNANYSLLVSGNFKADNIYNQNGQLTQQWIAGSPLQLYTLDYVGIGNTNPIYDIDIQNQYNAETTLRLQQSIGAVSTAIRLTGIKDEWIIRANDSYNRIEFGQNIINPSDYTKERYLWAQSNLNLNRMQIVIGSNLNVFNDPHNTDLNAILTVGGNLSVIGDVNIFGQYKMSGNVLINGNVIGPTPLSNLNGSSNDVFIGGDQITIYPNNTNINNKSVVIGNPNRIDDSILYVNKTYYTPNIATFVSSTLDAYINIIATNAVGGPGNKLKFGIDTHGNIILKDGGGNNILFFNKNNTTNANYVGFGNFGYDTSGYNTNPDSIIEIKTYGTVDNMFKLTQILGTPQYETGPAIDLEQKILNIGNINLSCNIWRIQGPVSTNGIDTSYSEKLRFIYTSNIICGGDLNVIYNSSSEVFSFTDTGFLGINNPQPSYSLDVINTNNSNGASLRILDYGINSSYPQIVLQAKPSNSTNTNGYAGDIYTDYKMAIQQGNFILQSASAINAGYNYLTCSSNGYIGMFAQPNSLYSLNLSSTLNVQSTINNQADILIDGVSIFKKNNATSNLIGKDVYLTPEINAEFYGGVLVNYPKQHTGNLFHMVSGCNANMLVLDSEYYETQVNYVCYNGDPNYLNTKNIFRNGTTSNAVYWEFASNIDFSRGNKNLSDSHTIFTPVASFTQSFISAQIAGVNNNFDLNLTGTLNLYGQFPFIFFGEIPNGPNPSPGAGIGLYGNGGPPNLIIKTTNDVMNIGIGIVEPYENIHLYNQVGSTLIENGYQSDILQLVSHATQVVTFDNNGNIGIGTTMPRTQLDIIGSIYTTSNSVSLPAYSFSSSSNTGIYLPVSNTLGFVTNSNEALRIDQNGNIGIGIKDTTMAFVSMSNSTSSVPLLNIIQSGTGNILQVNNIINNITSNVFMIDYNGNVGIGNTMPTCNVDIIGDVNINGHAYISSNVFFGANIDIYGNTYTHGNTITDSDSNIKKNINRISGALDKITQISGYTFNLISNDIKSTGLIAQEVNNVLPEAVSQDGKGVYGIAYGNMMGLIVESIKELKSEIEAIKNKIGM